MSIKTGEIELSDQTRFIFSVENVRGEDYGSVRLWADLPKYSGPTPSGLFLVKPQLQEVSSIISALTPEIIENTQQEKIIEQIPLSRGRSIRISLQYFKAKPKLDIREYVQSGNYEGYTKRGVSIYPGHFRKFIEELDKLIKKIPEPKQQVLFQERSDKKLPDGEIIDVTLDQSEIDKIRKQSKEKSKEKQEESIFSRLFEYYWSIQKSKTGFADLTDLTKIIDYYDLSEYLEKEELFSGNRDEIVIRQPEVKKQRKEDGEISVEEEAFEKLKKLFLAYQDNSYERELVFGFPYIFFSDKENDKTIAAPLFVAPCKLEYDTTNNNIHFSLRQDDFELNIAALNAFLGEEGQDYIREELIKNRPHFPLEEPQYKEFLVTVSNLLGFGLGREDIPSSFELEDTPYKNFLKQDKEVKIVNKVFILLVRKSSFYILSDLEKLVSLGDEVANSILSKFFDPEEVGVEAENADNREEFEFQQYLFPFANNADQRHIVDTLSKDLILVHGPPGTGKSQTISNLICHLVANGKTVLVSSQKNKALEVIDEKLQSTDLNYLQMTLLKNDTEAKKELIDKITDLDYYINKKFARECEERKIDLNKEYSEIEEEIARLTNLFDETKESVENNEEIFRQYSKVKQYNLIQDDVPFLTTKNMKEFQRDFLELIGLLREVLPNEQVIKTFIESTGCSPKNTDQISRLLKNLIDVRTERRRYLHKQEFSNLNKLVGLKGGSSEYTLLEKTKSLLSLSKKYDELVQELNKVEVDLVEGLLGGLTLDEILEQQSKLEVIKGNLEAVREYKPFADLINTDDPTEIEGILNLVHSIKKSKGIFKKIAEMVALFKKLQYRGIISPKIFGKFHKPHILDDLENACLYKRAEVSISRTCRDFYFGEIVNDYLKKSKLQVSELSRKLDNLLSLLKTEKEILVLLNSYFKFNNTDLKKLASKFSTLERFATALNNYYVYQTLYLKEQSIAKDLKPLLKAKYLEIASMLEKEDNLENKTLEELLGLINKAITVFKANDLQKELQPFQKTISSIKDSIISKTKFVDNFESHIEDIFACEMLDNQIKEFEQKYPMTTEEIARKISKLKKQKTDTVIQIIQNAIDINLIANYSYSYATQKDVGHFKRQIRRSRKSYKTFEELKEEFNFEALLKVFPCWTMSIEDVARVFPLKAGLFDYIIIDEASQCSLPSSIPTLFRGRKAIIVGDDKQLSDFTKGWIPNTLNEALIKQLKLRAFKKFDSLDARANSLFDSCSVFREAPILLSEHFRSYPEIINFSNQKFYSNKLRIMTHSLNNTLGNILNIVQVEDASENELKINEHEAFEIVSHLKKLINNPKYKNLSFGILSLFREQANFIRKLIYDDELLREKIKDHLIIADTVDGFQGDERDIILYSFRYAKNSSPHIFTFTRGEDGWRRANVGFTRARKQLFCFVSQPVEKFPSGLIKEFLQYTQAPSKSLIKEGLLGSDFEKDVYNILNQEKDLVAIPQFETCGFFVDFVLMKNGKTLALECDGMHHYTETGDLIEADIERQDILERAGWTIERISSREFYRDMKGSIDRILGYFN